jgi:hypothetical protein
MLDLHTVLAVLQLDSIPRRAPVVVNALWMQEKYAIFIRGLFGRRGFF